MCHYSPGNGEITELDSLIATLLKFCTLLSPASSLEPYLKFFKGDTVVKTPFFDILQLSNRMTGTAVVTFDACKVNAANDITQLCLA